MANEEQLVILRQGVEVWNKWRAEKPFVKIDLSQAHLIGTDLRYANLRKANLHSAHLSTILHDDHSIISETKLGGADLKDATFQGTVSSRICSQIY